MKRAHIFFVVELFFIRFIIAPHGRGCNMVAYLRSPEGIARLT